MTENKEHYPAHIIEKKFSINRLGSQILRARRGGVDWWSDGLGLIPGVPSPRLDPLMVRR